MAIEPRVKERAQSLIQEGEALGMLEARNATGHRARCAAWIAATLNITDQICDRDSQYSRQVQLEVTQFAAIPLMIGQTVAGLTGILRNMVSDAEGGLIGSVADRASAETFDNFLDHGEAYWRENRKEPAGAIAGVVFEDSVKRLCHKIGVDTAGRDLDNLISALASSGSLTGVEAKRARAAAGVRNSALHAHWGEFSLDDVSATINFLRTVILPKLDV